MNKQKGFTTIFGILLALLVIIGVGFFVFNAIEEEELPLAIEGQKQNITEDVSADASSGMTKEESVIEEDEGQECIRNIVINSNGDNVNPSFKITGVIDNTSPSCFWGVFEGEAGGAQIYFSSKGEWLKVGDIALIDITDENWMKPVNNFEINVGFNNEGIGLSNEPLKVVLKDNNPKDDSINQIFEIPLEI